MPRSNLTLDHLHPFRSYVLTQIRGTITASQVLNQTLDDVKTTLDDRTGCTVVKTSDIVTSSNAQCAFIHYKIEKPPAWTANLDVIDRTNELFLAILYKKHLAMYCSETPLRSSIQRQIAKEKPDLFKALNMLPESTISSALIADKSPRTLWLSGIHRRTPSKADNKVLSGLDLRYALDPMGDQSFFFTAARTSNKLAGNSKAEPIGVAPRKSAVWIGLARNWAEHRETAKTLIDLITKTKGAAEPPLPVLAAAAPTKLTHKQLGQVYDAAFLPPEMLDSTSDSDERELMEYASGLILEVKQTSSSQITLTVAHPAIDNDNVQFILKLDIGHTERVSWKSSLVKPPTAPCLEMAERTEKVLAKHPAWLKLWFDSGYTLADRSLFMTRHRDVPFQGWMWHKFNNYNVKKEKPKVFKAKQFGKEDSLFCWVVNQKSPPWLPKAKTYGWLASNDGAMEIADFIHVDPQLKTLSLIHVKGSGSPSPNRRVSVSSYEVVVGQAVKNLRHVDNLIMSKGFTQSLNKWVEDAVWKDGKLQKKKGREPMQKTIDGLGSNYERQVVIIQPHVRKSALETARNSTSDTTRLPVRQLDTLLLGARASCLGMGAELVVIGEDA